MKESEITSPSRLKQSKTKDILKFLIGLYEKQENIKIEYQILNVMEEK